jgi:hypothetical protein
MYLSGVEVQSTVNPGGLVCACARGEGLSSCLAGRVYDKRMAIKEGRRDADGVQAAHTGEHSESMHLQSCVHLTVLENARQSRFICIYTPLLPHCTSVPALWWGMDWRLSTPDGRCGCVRKLGSDASTALRVNLP